MDDEVSVLHYYLKGMKTTDLGNISGRIENSTQEVMECPKLNFISQPTLPSFNQKSTILKRVKLHTL